MSRHEGTVTPGFRMREDSQFVDVYATRRNPPAIAFPHVLLYRHDRNDPELSSFLDKLIASFRGRGDQVLIDLVSHFEYVRHHFSLIVNPPQRRALSKWAREANAVWVLRGGAVCAPDGKTLVNAKTGAPDPGAEVPFPADARKRKATTEAALSARGLIVPKGLPRVISEIEVELREPSEVAARCFALFACAMRAESLVAGEPIPVEELQCVYPIAFDALSLKERAFMARAEPPPEDTIVYVARYEALAVLAWAARVLDGLPFPDSTTNVRALAKTFSTLDAMQLVAKAQLRPTGDILDALDLTFRVHWATVNARLHRERAPAGLDPEVIRERHHVLRWLTRLGSEDWADVMPT